MLVLAYDSAALLALRVENPATYRSMIDAAIDYARFAETADTMAKAATARLALTGLELRAAGGAV